MRICCGYTIAFDTFGLTPMVLLLNVRPERRPNLRSCGAIVFYPPVPARQFRDPFGNVVTCIVVPDGRIAMSADFGIDDCGQPYDYASDGRQMPVGDLADEVLPLLLGSRYRHHQGERSHGEGNPGALSSPSDKCQVRQGGGP